MDKVDAVVIGAGVVGLAIARALALGGREVMILEAESHFGSGISSRNSEVIHAGIYYPPGSLKARLCVRGRTLLYDYCAARHVPHRRCGKLIVATEGGQRDALEALRRNAEASSVHDLEMLDGDRARAMEPALSCVAALWSPSTGIVDSHALMLSLLGDAENAGALIAYHSEVTALAVDADGVVVSVDGEALLRAALVVNATGLNAPSMAAAVAGAAGGSPAAHYAKGSYFTLSGCAPFDRLIYPVPEPGGLGVHLTLDMGGQAKFGPDVEWIDAPDYDVDPARGDRFYAAVRRYWPGLPDGALQPGYVGIRPKISGPGDPAADFRIDAAGTRDGMLVHLFGIESPGLTASLAIAEHVAAIAERGTDD
jgi:L-2-hydroxyglutarate oxidase LhgO